MHEAESVTDNQTVAVVGLDASAGGNEAIAQFFDAMPAASGAAFVVVLHLSPDRESQLSSIVARHTSMPVTEIVDGLSIHP
jgi:two-component system CheB/CheR fusion protein